MSPTTKIVLSVPTEFNAEGSIFFLSIVSFATVVSDRKVIPALNTKGFRQCDIVRELKVSK